MAGRIQGITVEIGGDTTKLQTALKGVNLEIRNTQSQLKDVDKLLKLDPGNTELLAQKHRLLGDAVKETKEKLETLKTAAEQANTALANGEITQSQYDGLQREIAETEAKLKTLEEQANKSATALQKIAATGDKLKSVGNSITGVGKALAPVSAAAAAAGAVGVKAAMDWETAFTGVKKTVDATEAEYEELGKGIQQLATETASSMEEIAGVAEVAGQLGIAKENLLDFTKTMVQLGDTTNLSAEEAATALARFLNITGESTGNVDRLGAAIVDLGNNFATDEAAIVAMSTRLASAGTLAGMTSTDILALSTAMSSVGIEAEAGGTAMTQTLTALEAAVADFSADSTEDLEAIASVANMSAADFASAWKSHPIEAVQAFISGLGQLDEKGESATLVLDELGMSGVRQSNMLKSLALASDVLSDAIDTSSTAYQENTALTIEAEKRYGTFESQVSQLKESFKTIAIDIGETLIPIIKSLMESLKGVVEWWKNLSDGQREFIVKAGLLVAALSPVLIIIGKLITAVGTIMTVIPKIGPALTAVKGAFAALNAVMMANPIILIIAAIAALVAAFIYLWNNCEEFRQFWINLWESIKEVAVAVWEWLKTFFAAAWETIKATAETVWTAISTFFTGLWDGIKNTFTTVVTAISTFLQNAWSTISNAAATVWNAISTFFTTIWTAIQNTFTTVVNAIATFLTNAWNTVKNTTSTVWNTISSFFTNIWNGIKNTVTSVMNAISSFISTAWNNIKNTVTTVGNAIKNAVNTVWTNITSAVKNAMSNVFDAVKSGFASVRDHIVGLASEAFNWGKDLIMGIVNGIKSVIGKVGEAVSDVASTIREFLHFSVPDKGPLTDYESWMPDFIGGLAKGIKQSRGLIDKAMAGITGDMVISPRVLAADGSITAGGAGRGNADLLSGISSAISTALAGNAAAGDIVIPVYLGTDMIDEIVVTAQQRMNLRSGGR